MTSPRHPLGHSALTVPPRAASSTSASFPEVAPRHLPLQLCCDTEIKLGWEKMFLRKRLQFSKLLDQAKSSYSHPPTHFSLKPDLTITHLWDRPRGLDYLIQPLVSRHAFRTLSVTTAHLAQNTKMWKHELFISESKTSYNGPHVLRNQTRVRQPCV